MGQEKRISAAHIIAALIILLAYASADAATLNSSTEEGSLKALSNSSNFTGATALNESLNSSLSQDGSQSDVSGSIKQTIQSAGPLASEAEVIGSASPERESATSKNAEIATYVYNDDNDKLEVSLYIDSVPRGKAEVDKGSEEKFDNYTLETGIHRFKIIWKDPDTDKVYESEQKREVSGDDAVRLYTTEHLESQKFNLLVSAKNENYKETAAYLYIDGKFEKSQNLKELSTSEFETVSVEEGMHDVSLRWLDPSTNSEYEKKKRVTVDDDKAVAFIATKGISFEEKSEATSTPETPQSETSSDETYDSKESVPDGITSSIEANNSTGVNNTDINDNTDVNNAEINSSSDIKSDVTDANSNSLGAENAAESKDEETSFSLLALKMGEKPGTEEADAAKGANGTYPVVYLAVLLIAVYLVFRR